MYLYTALEKATRLLNQTLLAYIRSYTELFTFFPVFLIPNVWNWSQVWSGISVNCLLLVPRLQTALFQVNFFTWCSNSQSFGFSAIKIQDLIDTNIYSITFSDYLRHYKLRCISTQLTIRSLRQKQDKAIFKKVKRRDNHPLKVCLPQETNNLTYSLGRKSCQRPKINTEPYKNTFVNR